MASRRRLSLGVLLTLGWVIIPSRTTAVPVAPVMLWQEDTYWDGLLTGRSREIRQSADPNLIPVLRIITQQLAQQSLNLRQIEAYTKVQQDNLQFALQESNPSESLATIQANLDTLAQGTRQIRSNLCYIGVRCRLASSQALPDPKLTTTAAALIKQVQSTQLQLNTLYIDAAAFQAKLKTQVRPRQNFLRFRAHLLVRSILETQDSIFTVYNASYEIYLRSKQ